MKILKMRRRTRSASKRPRPTSSCALLPLRRLERPRNVDDFAELGIRSRGVPVEQLDDVLLEVSDMKSELLRLRELVGVLVRRERCAEVKMEVAARRLDWMEHEKTKSTLPSMKPFLRKISRTSPKS